MYALASHLKGLPIISLQTGQAIAVVGKPLLNEATLEVLALNCLVGNLRRQRGVVLMRDIRQIAVDAIIIDSLDEIEDANEIVRLKDIAKRNFDPLGKNVINESGHRLGRVEDYTINTQTHMLKKLYVHQSLMKSILFNSLVIDRTQIIDVTSKHFTVRDTSVTEPTLGPQPIPSK